MDTALSDLVSRSLRLKDPNDINLTSCKNKTSGQFLSKSYCHIKCYVEIAL